MAKKYVIWDEKCDVITPSGRVFTAEQWMDEFPMARLDYIELVISGGVINGALCDVYQNMIERYEKTIDFSNCKTKQECLDLIEEYEDNMMSQSLNVISNEELTASALASIAASLEYQNMLTLDDVEEEI